MKKTMFAAMAAAMLAAFCARSAEPVFATDYENAAAGIKITEGVTGKGLLVSGSSKARPQKFMVPDVLKNECGTVAFWFKPIAWDESYPRNLDLFHAKAGRSIVRIYKNAVNLKSSMSRKLVFLYGQSKNASGGPGFQRVAAPASLYGKGNWTFVAATWSNGRINLYVNGRLIASNEMAEPIKPISEFTIGDASAGADTAFDNVAIYDKALTEEEISALCKSARR